jgi:hypothetical protein
LSNVKLHNFSPSQFKLGKIYEQPGYVKAFSHGTAPRDEELKDLELLWIHLLSYTAFQDSLRTYSNDIDEA